MTDSDDLAEILVENRQDILCIRINRPLKKNALTLGMYAQLDDAFQHAMRDKAVRVIWITGTDDCFTSGNDINDFITAPPADESSPVMQFLITLHQTLKPIVASVHGPAIGIGTTLLLHCDLVYAAHDAFFQLPFVNLGLCPEAASSYLLPRLVGHQRAAELLLLGEPVSADRAEAIGIVNQVFPKTELNQAVWEIARKLAAKPPESVRLTKALLKQADVAPVKAAMSSETRLFIQRLASSEAAEAFRAFFEHREPDFSKLA